MAIYGNIAYKDMEQAFDCNPNYGHKVKLKYVGAYQVTEVNCQGEIYKVTIKYTIRLIG